jgi:hypothetical protein
VEEPSTPEKIMGTKFKTNANPASGVARTRVHYLAIRAGSGVLKIR